jgi:hypothetical protein
MKKQLLFFLMTSSLIGLSSCNDKNDEYDDVGKATIVSLEGPSNAYMGDSVSFTFNVADDGEIPLSTTKVQILYGDEIVSERIVLTGTSGTYSGKILIPFLKDIPDGDATVRLHVKNARYAADVKDQPIAVSRPSFPYLTLKTTQGDYRMDPVEGQPYIYKVTGNFPSELYGYIEAPKYSENGNVITFGSSDGKIVDGIKSPIEFTADGDGEYTVTFNALTYEGSPFIKFALNGNEFIKIDDNNSKVEMNLTAGQEIQITGLKSDYSNYWIDPAFFNIKKGTNGKILKFRGMDGKYRVTVNKALKYFNVELMNGSALSILGSGDGAIWINGDGNIGKPSYSTNKLNWSTNKSLCMTPIGNRKHQIIFEAGKSINTINFKFYGQKDFVFEFTKDKISIIDGSSWFAIPSSDGNIRAGSKALTKGKFYILTVDVSAGVNKATLSVEEVTGFNEVD